MPKQPQNHHALAKLQARRDFIRKAAAGTAVVALGGGVYYLASDDLTAQARAQVRQDGKKRLPSGQRVLRSLRPMGGKPGDPRPKNFRLRIHGEVNKELVLDYQQLLKLPNVDEAADVHCVTGWSVLGAKWVGVRVQQLAKAAGLKPTARHVIFEAAHGYTANVPISVAMDPATRIVHRYDGRPLARAHGGPVRALVPDRYFWKSSKWLTGIRFVRRDQPGYWETRGYHNNADPWLEQRHS